MLFNGSLFNRSLFNGIELPDGILAIGVGNLCSIEQSVALNASDLLLSIVQDVELSMTGVGQICEIDQQVGALAASTSICTIRQFVTETGSINPNPSTPVPHYIIRNGWYPVYTVGSYVWPDAQISDSFKISRTETNESSLTFTLQFTKYTDYGAIDFELFDGQSISLDIYYLEGYVDRIFTGYVNKVAIDIIKGTITCTCTDARRELILNDYTGQVENIGYYSETILGQTSDEFEELDKRLTTVPMTVDVDRFGNLQTSNLLPGGVNFVFTDSDVYRDGKDDPKVEKLLRSRVVNTINLKLSYQYQRLFQAHSTYRWTWGIDTCTFLLDGYSLALRETVQTAIKGTGWVLNAPIAYTGPPANNLYHCSGMDIPYTTVNTTNVQFTTVKDASGNVVNGTDGKPLVQNTNSGTFTDSRNLLCTQAEWRQSFRWTQNVKEDYTLTFTAPQSIARYGLIPQTEEFTVDDGADTSDWEKYTAYQDPVTLGLSNVGNLYYKDNTPNRAKFNIAFFIAVNRARTTIIKAHRDNRVTFSIPLNSNIEMYHTVYLNTDRIQAVGKVVNIEHTAVIADGDAFTTLTIALCRSLGSASDSALAPPVAPTQPPAEKNWDFSLGSIYGTEPSSTFQGFVGNKWVTQEDYTFGFRGSNTYKTTVPERFIVKSEGIGSAYRDLLTLNQSGFYSMSLPNNTLTVNFLK